MTDDQKERLNQIVTQFREGISGKITYQKVIWSSWSVYLATLPVPDTVKRCLQARRATVRQIAKHLGHKLTEADVIQTFGPIAADLMAIIGDDLERMQKPMERKPKLPTVNEAISERQRTELRAIQNRFGDEYEKSDMLSSQSLYTMSKMLYLSLLLMPKQTPKVARMRKGIMSRHYPRRKPTRDEIIAAYGPISDDALSVILSDVDQDIKPPAVRRKRRRSDVLTRILRQMK